MACVPGRVLSRADDVFTKHKETVREVLKGPALRIVVAELAESVAKDILLRRHMPGWVSTKKQKSKKSCEHM